VHYETFKNSGYAPFHSCLTLLMLCSLLKVFLYLSDNLSLVLAIFFHKRVIVTIIYPTSSLLKFIFTINLSYYVAVLFINNNFFEKIYSCHVSC